MQPSPHDSKGSILIGPFQVRVERFDIAAFTSALGSADGELKISNRVPLTFPIRWLGLPDVRQSLSPLIGAQQGVMVHESQTFEYASPIEPERDYSFTIEIRRDPNLPQRIMLNGVVLDFAGSIVVKTNTVLRLFTPDKIGSEQL